MRILGAGLPNFTGWFALGFNAEITSSVDNALFYKNGSVNSAASAHAWSGHKIYIDPSRVNSIYGASETVQPNALAFLPQIKY